jgi:LPXTG-motif cell wall-anchored protein
MTGTADPATIQAEIEATRARLGQTVDEIGARLDVRAHAREKAFVARDIAVETYRESPPVVLGGALALVGLVAGLVVWRRKRATRRRNR